MEENLKKKNSNLKKIILGSFLGILIGSLLGTTYAMFTYERGGTTNSKLIAGDIYMKYTGTNELDFPDAMPSNTYTSGKYFQFEITGKNTTTDKPIIYDIVLNPGVSNPNSRTQRIRDEFLKFRLVEVVNPGEANESETELIASRSYNTISNTRMYKTTIPAGGANSGTYTKVYRIYAWISDSVVIGNVNQDYTESEWANLYASIAVTVTGDFTDKEITLPGELAATKIMNIYEDEGAGTDGLYAVNTDGDLAGSEDTIREYRYSGANPNNYIYFNGSNELWRIVGVFNGELKIVKDTALSNVTLTNNNYTHTDPQTSVETAFNLKSSEQAYGSTLYWNKHVSGTNNNDWTTAGLQYYLNDANNENSYYYNINSAYKSLIKTNTVYYLGNVTISNSNYMIDATAKQAREQERGTTVCDSSVTSWSQNANPSCNIWNGNQATWEGAIGLLYPSDFGYANATNLWGVNLSTYSASDFKHNNWILDPNASAGYYWFLSPSSRNPSSAMDWGYDGIVGNDFVGRDRGYGVRPVLNLKSDTRIYGGDGSISSPYTLIEQ